MSEQYNQHVILWYLWCEYQMHPSEQIKMFHRWVDIRLGNVGLQRLIGYYK